MAFGGGSKPAKMLPTPKVVQTSHKLSGLNIAKPKGGAGNVFSKPAPRSACCGGGYGK